MREDPDVAVNVAVEDPPPFHWAVRESLAAVPESA